MTGTPMHRSETCRPGPGGHKRWMRHGAEVAMAALVVAIYILLVTRGRVPDWGLW